MKQPSKTTVVAAKTIQAALNILRENGGELSANEIINQISQRVKFDSWESGRYEKTGYIRWQSIFLFYSIDLVKAGYIFKQKGIWYITKEGISASKYSKEKILENITSAYRKWDAQRKKVSKNKVNESDISVHREEEIQQKINLEQIEASADEDIIKYIQHKEPYEFQDLVAALLKAMGYYCSFVAAKGEKDGGVDIIAYVDPLGSQTPRTYVQVKHRPEGSVPVQDIRHLMAVVVKDGDVGLFVTSGSYSKPAIQEARKSHKHHIELIDINRFINLWKEYYSKMDQSGKNLLPLVTISILNQLK